MAVNSFIEGAIKPLLSVWRRPLALAGILLLTTYNRVYRWTLRQKAQDRELSAIRKENTLLTYGVLACLKGLEEQGCDGPVHEAIDKIERDLNLRAHDQEGNCG